MLKRFVGMLFADYAAVTVTLGFLLGRFGLRFSVCGFSGHTFSLAVLAADFSPGLAQRSRRNA